MNSDIYKIDGAVFGERPSISKSKHAISAMQEMRPVIKKIASRVLNLPTADESVRHENSIFDRVDIQKIQQIIIEEAGFKIALSIDVDYVTKSDARVVASYKVLTPDGYITLRTASSQCSHAEIEQSAYGNSGDELLWAEARALRYLMKNIGIIPYRPEHEYSQDDSLDILKPHQGEQIASADEHLEKNSGDITDNDYQDSLDAFSGGSLGDVEASQGVSAGSNTDASVSDEKSDPVDTTESVDEKTPTESEPAKQVKSAVKVAGEDKDSAVSIDDVKKEVTTPASKSSTKSKKPSSTSAISRLAARTRKSDADTTEEKSEPANTNAEVEKRKDSYGQHEELKTEGRAKNKQSKSTSMADSDKPSKEKPSEISASPKKLEKSTAVKSKNEAKIKESPAQDDAPTKSSGEKPSLSKAKLPRGLGALANLTKKKSEVKPIDEESAGASKRGRKRGSKAAPKKSTVNLGETKAPPVDTDVLVKKEAQPSIPDEHHPVVSTPNKEVAPRAKIQGVKVDKTGLSRDEIINFLEGVASDYGIPFEVLLKESLAEGPFTREELSMSDLDRLYKKYNIAE